MGSLSIFKTVSVILLSVISFMSIVFCYCKSCAYRNRRNPE